MGYADQGPDQRITAHNKTWERVMVQREEAYEGEEFESEQEEDDTTNDNDEGISIIEARWFVICLAVVVPLWIWPFDIADVFIGLSVSMLKAAGWLVGIAAVVFFGSVALAALSDAALKEPHRPTETSSDTPAKGRA